MRFFTNVYFGTYTCASSNSNSRMSFLQPLTFEEYFKKWKRQSAVWGKSNFLTFSQLCFIPCHRLCSHHHTFTHSASPQTPLLNFLIVMLAMVQSWTKIIPVHKKGANNDSCFNLLMNSFKIHCKKTFFTMFTDNTP